jgi:hypothetical protein
VREKGWSREFEDPIDLPAYDAGGSRQLPHEVAGGRAERCRMAGRDRGVDHGGGRSRPLLHARVGVLRALNRHFERVFNLDRKITHWGKRKLKRDE